MIRKITGYEIGIVAIGIGYLVGKAVRKGAGGFGGTRYQVLAVFLTYAAIALASLLIGRHRARERLDQSIQFDPDSAFGWRPRFRALANHERLVCAAALGVRYAFTRQGFVGVIALLALARGFERRPAATHNTRVLSEYLGLATLLALISLGK